MEVFGRKVREVFLSFLWLGLRCKYHFIFILLFSLSLFLFSGVIMSMSFLYLYFPCSFSHHAMRIGRVPVGQRENEKTKQLEMQDSVFVVWYVMQEACANTAAGGAHQHPTTSTASLQSASNGKTYNAPHLLFCLSLFLSIAQCTRQLHVLCGEQVKKNKTQDRHRLADPAQQ